MQAASSGLAGGRQGVVREPAKHAGVGDIPQDGHALRDHRVGKVGVGQQQAGRGVPQTIAHPIHRVAGIDGHIGPADLEDRQQRQGEGLDITGGHADDIAPDHAGAEQSPGEAVGAGGQFIGDAPAIQARHPGHAIAATAR